MLAQLNKVLVCQNRMLLEKWKMVYKFNRRKFNLQICL